jgi:uncharacterized protein (DUF1499 family)
MKVIGFIVFFIVAIMGAVVLVGQIGLLGGKPPTDLGVKNGRLKQPSNTPNSVTSQADLYPNHPQKEYARIAPIQFKGDGDKAMLQLTGILRESDRTVIVTQGPEYIYAQSTTRVLKFTDDVEFWLDRSAGVIQVRSASRLGGKDFNVNRMRIESIRAQFAKN